MGLFDSLANLATNVVKVALAPVDIAADLTNAAMQPIVEVAEEITKDIKSLKD